MSYTVIFRERALEALLKGSTKIDVNKMLGLGVNTLKNWEKLKEETGSLENKPSNRGPYKINHDELRDYYRENPFSTNKEAALAFNCSVSGIRSAKRVLKITRKKATIQYKERDEQEREEFIAELAALPEDSELYYSDESGFLEYYSRDYGYAPRGEKVIKEISGKRFARTSVVAAKNGSDIVAPFAFKGSMNGDLYLGWLEYVFVPELKDPAKSVLIIDNASFHPKNAIYDMANEYGFKVMFLPAYSPDLNPIEKFWGNVKNRLRLHMHKFSTFWEAMMFAFN